MKTRVFALWKAMRARAGARASYARRAPEEEVRRIVQSPGRALAPETRADMEKRFGSDFSDVRVHADREAARSAASLEARAYTFKNHLVFGAGEYAPHTGAGRRLIAHELAHTVQQARSGATSTVQRTPFPGESAELETRRTKAIVDMRLTIATIEKAMRAGYLWPFESQSADKIENPYADPVIHTEAQRAARLAKLVDDLWATVAELEGGPAPEDWFEPKVEFPGEGTNYGDNVVQALYGHRMKSLGMDGTTVYLNWLYLNKDPVPTRVVKGVREDYGIALGEWLVVKDPDNRPQEWVRLTGYDPIDGRIVELRWDRRGYYYYYEGRKIYLPKYPGH